MLAVLGMLADQAAVDVFSRSSGQASAQKSCNISFLFATQHVSIAQLLLHKVSFYSSLGPEFRSESGTLGYGTTFKKSDAARPNRKIITKFPTPAFTGFEFLNDVLLFGGWGEEGGEAPGTGTGCLWERLA